MTDIIRTVSLFDLLKPFIDAVDGEFTDTHLQSKARDAVRLKTVLEQYPDLKKLLAENKVNIAVDNSNHDLMST